MAIFSFLARRKRKKKLVVKEKYDIIGKKKGRIKHTDLVYLTKNNLSSAVDNYHWIQTTDHWSQITPYCHGMIKNREKNNKQ